MKDYELIEHTADIGIRVVAKDLKGLFENTAAAIFDIMAEVKHSGSLAKKTIEITQTADDWDGLLVNWLNELLSLSATKELIFSDFKILQLEKNRLKAQVTATDLKNYQVKCEIKAATYHELEIKNTADRWQVQVILDV